LYDLQEITMTTPTTQGRLRLSLCTLALLSTSWAQAQTSTPTATPWYAGASIGNAQATIDDARIQQSLAAAGFANASVSDSNHDTGYKLFGGYQVNPRFALEGSYFDMGSMGYQARATATDTLAGKLRLRGIGLDAVLRTPLADKWSVFGKVGAQYHETRDSFAATGGVQVRDANPSNSELNLKLGLGLQYTLSDTLAVRGEWERYRINDAVGSRGEIDHLSVGLVYTWGPGSYAAAQ
jgi:OOP family OmpA-OmpF porin